MTPKQKDKHTPKWSRRAKHIDSKPDWIDFIPHELWDIGDAFFPIPRGKKSNRWPFHIEEKRFSADDEILNAYLEAGSGFGIVCIGDLAVLDIDDMDYKDEILKNLPDTIHQVTGSRTGEHHFYYCEDIDTRIILHDKVFGEKLHIGEFKCDAHEYVVGPGSVHPSGNKYGPLEGDKITTVTEDQIKDALEDYITDNETHMPQRKSKWDAGDRDFTQFYKLGTDDVLPWLERGKNVSHPVHGSKTGHNFRKSEDEDVFICWRCQYGSGPGCGIHAAQFLAIEATGKNCDTVRANWDSNPVLHYEGWRNAYDHGLVRTDNEDIPLRILKGYGVKEGLIDKDDKITIDNRWDILNPFLYQIRYLESQE